MPSSRTREGSGIIAILAILLVIAMAAFIAWRAGIFGGEDHDALGIDTSSSSR